MEEMKEKKDKREERGGEHLQKRKSPFFTE
jgi:hypothetical protein